MNNAFKVFSILVASCFSILAFSYLLLEYSFPHIVIGLFDFGFILIATLTIQKLNTKDDL
jgi:hypothetical protein